MQLGMTQMLFSIRNFINGEFVEPISGKYLDNIEPATGKPYSRVADASPTVTVTDWKSSRLCRRSWSG
jgi:aminomuconate-semialdehyde/2-hydroxymuconate-6-semialdehyde dehydrogenase